jgi:hypothetical protein
MQKLSFFSNRGEPVARVADPKHASGEVTRFLFLAPPNITYDDFVNPPPNISTI